MHAFLKQYNEVAVPKLKEQQSYSSPYLIPKIEKVVINVGLGDLIAAGKPLEELVTLVTLISGQKPVTTKARKAISGFKIRQGMEVGMKVTLRGARMHDFLIKLIQIALPRTRDFRGLKPSAVAPNGSLNLGIKDSMIFPEVSQGTFAHGMQITIVPTPCTSEEARLLYESLGFIFHS
jgi:large subunit ribosomal protein L5